MSTYDHRDLDAEIVASEGVLGGKPRLKGHRISVLDITEPLDTGHSITETAEQLGISEDKVRAASRYYRQHRADMVEYEEQRHETFRQHRERPRGPAP